MSLAPPLAGEPAAWDEAFEYFWWAERFGWTPDQVDTLPVGLHARIPLVAKEVDDWREEETRRNSA